MRIRVALHTGEVELRDGDYFGRAVNRAARLRSLAAGGQILCSGATAELVIDSLSDDVILADLGMRQLRNLARPEHVFELRLETADDSRAVTTDTPMERPGLPAVLAGPGPFVGRGRELERLLSAWQTALDGGAHAVLIAGEPGVGKTRLAGEWSRHAYEQGAVVLYGRCDEDLGAPYQPFAEALRSLIPCLGASRLRGLRGVEALLSLVPGLTDVLPDLAAPTRADPDTERYALFDAVVAVLGVASTSAPVVLILDDLHWAAKPTLLLLRHLLRFGEHARVQIVGTYRSTDLDRSHPLAAMLADLHRDGSATRLQLSGLDEVDVSAYVAEAGYDDEELARALASVTGGNPFFLIEALRHVDESGGRMGPEHPAAGGSGSREPPTFSASGGDEQGPCGGRGGRQPVCARAGRAGGRRRPRRRVRRGVQGGHRHRRARWSLPVQPRNRPPVAARRAGVRAAHAAAPAHRRDTGNRARRRRRAAGRTGLPLLRMCVGGKRGQGRRLLQACRRSGDGTPGLRRRGRPLRPRPTRAGGA